MNKILHYLCWLAVIISFYSLFACSKSDKILYTSEKPFSLISAEVAPNGRHWYALCEAPEQTGNKKRFVIIHGAPGPEFDMILMKPAFTPQGFVAYAALSAGRWYVSVDGIIETPYKEVSAPIYTADGSRYAYMAREDRKSFIVDNGVPGNEFDYVSWPVFSYSHTLAYVTKTFPYFNVIIGDEMSESFDDADIPVFQNTGNHVAYPAARNKQWTIVADGLITEWWDAVGTPVHTIHGIAYPAKKYTKWFWYMQEKRGPGFDYIYGGTTSHDGTHIAYCAQENFERFAVIDGIPGDTFDNVACVVFSSSGSYAYRAEKSDKVFIVTNTGYSPVFDDVSMPQFSQRDNSLSYAAKNAGTWNIYHNHQPVFDDTYTTIGEITYSSENNCFFAIAQSGNKIIQLSWK